MFTFRVLFLLSAFFPIFFAKNEQENGTAIEQPFIPSDDLALDILRNGIAEQQSRSSENGTNGAANIASADVEGIAKTIIHLLVRSVNAVVRFFGDILAKVTRSLDDPVPRKRGAAQKSGLTNAEVNGTDEVPNFVHLPSEGAEVPNEAARNGTVEAASGRDES